MSFRDAAKCTVFNYQEHDTVDPDERNILERIIEDATVIGTTIDDHQIKKGGT